MKTLLTFEDFCNIIEKKEKKKGCKWCHKRDYKDEYEKFQSSDKMKAYRAELNKYRRDKGVYGNGDGKDASHKNGKIVGFEDASKNRGRAEKSRLKGSKRKKWK
jgi:hypothetical protein